MRALVKLAHGPDTVELRSDWPEPEPRPEWVIVDVIACGVCGTDIHLLHDQHKNWPPVVLGHEYVGRIRSVGAEVTNWAVGDRVVCEQHTLACGGCDPCRRGAIHLCAQKRSPGWGIDGAFAEQVALPANLLHRVPDNVSDLDAVACEPTAICITGLDRAQLQPGERVAVVGPGPVGLLTALVARACGATVTVFGRSTSSARLELASRLDFTVVTTDEQDAVGEGLRLTANLGYDCVVETSGAAAGADLAIELSRRMGRVVALGISGRPHISVPTDAAISRSLTIHFSMSSEYSTWDRALRLMSTGMVTPSALVTAYSLEDWVQAFDDVQARRVVKAVIRP